MKELHIDDDFDTLLSLAAKECVKEEAAAFLSADISGIEDDPQMLQKILRESRKNKNKWKALKIIALVAILCMSIAFTACMLIPEIRNVLWNVFVRERESSVEVGFETSSGIEFATESAIKEYPKTIEKKMEPIYMPEGWVQEQEIVTSSHYQIIYYSDDGIRKCFITQSVIGGVNSFINDKSGQITYIDINGSKGIFIEYDEEKDFQYSLTWQDSQYRYTIHGNFSSINEMVKIAEGIN